MLIHRIVILESDRVTREKLHDQLAKEHYQVIAPAEVSDPVSELSKTRGDVVIASADCLQGCQSMAEMIKQPAGPLFFVAADSSQLSEAFEWVERGAFDYLVKPLDWGQLRAALLKADRFLRSSLASRSRIPRPMDTAVLHGTSPAVAELRQAMRKIARTEATVLIQGEPGAGQENLAAALHGHSNRSKAPLLRMDCAAVATAESTDDLFGTYVPQIAIANGGTVVFEEVSQLELPAQEKLLRFCQSGAIECVGGRSVTSDVRIVATSSTPLEPKMKAGAFREDLFFRLDMARLDLPPLRERVPDIGEIANLFREYYTHKYGLAALALSPEAQLALTHYNWPGNLRELEQTIDRAVLRCGSASIILPEHLGLSVETAAATGPLIDSLAEIEKQHILTVLERCGGNRTHAAAKLEISIRTLRNKLREYRTTAAAAA